MNSKTPSVKRNFIYNILYQLLTIVTPLLVTPYVSRVLQPEGIGIYAYAYATANYFVLVTMMGLNNYGNRMIAKNRENRSNLSQVFWSIYLMQLSISIICIIGYILMVVIFKDNNIIYWIMILYVISAGIDITWFFQGLEEFRITVGRNAIVKIVSTICIFIFVKSKSDVAVYTLIMVGAIFLNQALLWPFVSKFVDHMKIEPCDIIKHIKPNMILFIPTIAISFYRVMDKIMLGAMSGTVEVGFYDSTDKLISLPLCIVTAFGTVMLPRMSNLVNKLKIDQLSEIVQKSLALAVLISAPIMAGMMSIITDFVPFYYGAGYDKCVILFYILLPSTLFIAMANVVRTQVLLPNELDKVFVWSCILGAITNAIINTLLIPKLGSVGAAIGTLVTEIIVFGVQSVYARKYVDFLEPLKFIAIVLFSSCLMGVIVYNLNITLESTFYKLAIKIVIGIVIYSLSLLVSAKITKNKLAKEILEVCKVSIKRGK